MVRAVSQSTPVPLSSLFRDPIVAEAFRRAERGAPPLTVDANRPAPVLAGGNASRILELA